MTSQELIEQVRALAAAYPDTVYPEGQCWYSRGNAGPGCGCLIGQALSDFDPELPRKLDCEFPPPKITSGKATLVIQSRFPEYRPMLSDQWWLELVQEAHDAGKPWGEAVRMVDKGRGENR